MFGGANDLIILLSNSGSAKMKVQLYACTYLPVGNLNSFLKKIFMFSISDIILDLCHHRTVNNKKVIPIIL